MNVPISIFFLILSHHSILDSLLYSRGPSNGLIIVFDMQNVGMRHLLRTNIDSLRTFFRYLQDALPAKLEAMHIVNCVSFFDMVMALIKPFMKSEIIQKVCEISIRFAFGDKLQLLFQMHLHHGSNYEAFHKECVPASCLPSDCGGLLKTASELHNEHSREFSRLRNYFIAEEKEAKMQK